MLFFDWDWKRENRKKTNYKFTSKFRQVSKKTLLIQMRPMCRWRITILVNLSANYRWIFALRSARNRLGSLNNFADPTAWPFRGFSVLWFSYAIEIIFKTEGMMRESKNKRVSFSLFHKKEKKMEREMSTPSPLMQTPVQHSLIFSPQKSVVSAKNVDMSSLKVTQDIYLTTHCINLHRCRSMKWILSWYFYNRYVCTSACCWLF